MTQTNEKANKIKHESQKNQPDLIHQKNNQKSDNENNFLIVNRAFFGKDNCLKVTLNYKKDCYFHWGINHKSTNKYSWIKVKFNDLELSQIISVLNNKLPSVAFFHKFGENSRQIWVNKADNATFIKVKELSKSLSDPESNVLKIILENCIWKMNSLET